MFPSPRSGVQGRGPVAEGDRGQVRRSGGEPADGIPAPAAVLIDTSHRQRMHACISSDRSPATGEARPVLTRQATLAGPKGPPSAAASGTPDTHAAAERSKGPAPVAYRSAVIAALLARNRYP
jgi:hypothetical protein